MWREIPRLIDEAAPNVGIGNTFLLSLASIKFVEVRRVGGGVAIALRGQTNPDDRNAAAFQRRDGGGDALDVSLLPLFRPKFPRAVGLLARLCRRQLAMLSLDRLPLQVRRFCRARFGWLFRHRVRRRGRRSFLPDSLAIVVSDHHDDQVGLFGRDDLAHHLRPFAVAARVVADQTGLGAMFAHDADLGIVGKGVFKPGGEPVSVRIAHHHDLDRGIPALRARGSVGEIFFDFSGSFPQAGRRSPFTLAISPGVPLAITPKTAVGIVRLLLA